jgi:hypothetical protein
MSVAEGEKISTDVEKVQPASPVHAEHALEKEASYIPQSDEEYQVTFKTWIVVSVRLPPLRQAKFSMGFMLLTFFPFRSLRVHMASPFGSCPRSAHAKLV